MTDTKDRIYIGVAWPYANGVLHLGHIAGSLLPPDIFARYHRMKGSDVLMVSGSDEHGTPITVLAEQEGVHPSEIVDRYHKINSDCLKRMGISFDLFTTTATRNHREVVHDIFLALHKKGYIYRKTITALYCEKCKKFLPDRYVEGTCPHCGFDSARGDQCEKCGKLLEPTELVSPKCKLCKGEPRQRATEHFFFKLSAFRAPLLHYLEDKGYWRENTQLFTQNWLHAGLNDRAITRDISWGVDVPIPGFEGKRIYVWFEAVCGYLSASKEWSRSKEQISKSGNPERWKDFWLDNYAGVGEGAADIRKGDTVSIKSKEAIKSKTAGSGEITGGFEKTRAYYFLGKDNIPFHTIIWPAILMAYGGLNLPYDVPANEYLTLKGEQFSKSRKRAIWLNAFLDTYDADTIRYYLSINMPENKDVDFTWDDFVRKNNDELVGAFGNFINRALMFTAKNFGTIPPAHEMCEMDKEALKKIEETYASVTKYLEACQFKNAMRDVMALSHFGDKYINDKAPWKQVKADKIGCETTMHISVRIAKCLSILSAPFIPHSAEKLWHMLGYEGSVHAQEWGAALEDVPSGQAIREAASLFKKLDLKEVLEREIGAGAGGGAMTSVEAPRTKDEKIAGDSKKSADGKQEAPGRKNAGKPDEKAAGKPSDNKSADAGKKTADGAVETITIDEFAKADIRVGTILEAKEHPDADKLMIMLVDIGSEKRQIVAGLKKHYTKEQLIGKRVLICANLKPVKLRGFDSNGMVLAADDGKGKVSLLTTDQEIDNGAKAK